MSVSKIVPSILLVLSLLGCGHKHNSWETGDYLVLDSINPALDRVDDLNALVLPADRHSNVHDERISSLKALFLVKLVGCDSGLVDALNERRIND